MINKNDSRGVATPTISRHYIIGETPMSSNNIYYYVYRITNIVNNTHYYGRRFSKILPKLDLGIKYFSSSSVKEFILDQKQNRHNYKYKIIVITKTKKRAIELEAKLHAKFDVAHHPNFINRINAHPNHKFATGTKHSNKTRQKMSENGIKGHNVYHHPDTLEVRYFKDDDKIPDGFIKGQHEKFREEASEKFIGDAFYHDPKTGEQIRIKPGDTIPDGYVKGKNETFVGFAFNKTTYTLLDLKDRCYHRVPNEHILKDHQLIYSGHKLENIMIYLFDNKMFVGIHRLSKYLYNMCILPIQEKRACPIETGFIDTSRYKNKTKRRIDTLDDDTKYRLLKIYDKSHLREHVSIIPLLKFDWNSYSHIQLIG